MLKAKRIATIEVDAGALSEELAILDATEVQGTYDDFTFGSWSAHVLANASGLQEDSSFRPYEGSLGLTELGRKVPGIMSIVTQNFPLDRLQWVRVFSLSDGILAPHVDFLEFSESGTRLQVPLRTDVGSLHSEEDTVYHLRQGEVWKIHATVPHSARSVSDVPRLSLCLDYSGTDESIEVQNTVPSLEPVHIVSRPPLTDTELEDLISSAAGMTLSNMRAAFRPFAAVHFERQAHAASAFDWFVAAAQRTGDPMVVQKAEAFRTYCIQKRGYRELFGW